MKTFLKAALLVLCAFCASCRSADCPGAYSVCRADFAETVNAKVGDLIEVSLASNKTTGYSWSHSGGGRQVLLEAENYELSARSNSGAPLCGAGGRQIFMFRCVNAGETRVEFFYARPWEKKPIDSAVLKIKVR